MSTLSLLIAALALRLPATKRAKERAANLFTAYGESSALRHGRWAPCPPSSTLVERLGGNVAKLSFQAGWIYAFDA